MFFIKELLFRDIIVDLYQCEFGSGFEQANFIPVGVNLLFKTNHGTSPLEIGGEISYGVSPFTFELGDGDVHFADLKINQLYFGGLAKFTIRTGGKVSPYIRGAAGIYTGNAEIEYTDKAKELAELDSEPLENKEIDIKNSFGFNVGVGLEFKINRKNALFFEFVYNIVEREFDEDDSEKFNANNWVVQVGISFGL